MSRFTEEHEEGVRAFTHHLEDMVRECSHCGFEDNVLHSEWRAHVETTSKPGHIVYRLTCPDCTSTEVVEVEI